VGRPCSVGSGHSDAARVIRSSSTHGESRLFTRVQSWVSPKSVSRAIRTSPARAASLRSACTPSSPTCDVAKLKSKVPVRLRPSFEAALGRRIQDNRLPPGVAVIPVKRKKHLHLLRYPLPTPPELELEKLIAAVPNSIHLSLHRNETSLACAWHLPRAHYLESWGDARAYDGTVSLQQPLIEPLFGGVSAIELLAMLTDGKWTPGRQLVRADAGPRPDSQSRSSYFL